MKIKLPVETADYHASLNKNSWFYVFDYQSKFGDYKTVRNKEVAAKEDLFSDAYNNLGGVWVVKILHKGE